MECNEPTNSWFPKIDYVDTKLESIINDRYDEHYHVVNNRTGYCETCGENVDGKNNMKDNTMITFKDKVCYQGKPYKVIGRKLDPDFFVLLGLDRSIETIHKKYLMKIEKENNVKGL